MSLYRERRGRYAKSPLFISNIYLEMNKKEWSLLGIKKEKYKLYELARTAYGRDNSKTKKRSQNLKGKKDNA